MPFQPVPNGALVVVKGKVKGQDCLNTLGFGLKTPGSVLDSQVQALVVKVEQYWVDNMLPILPADYEYRETTIQALDAVDGVQAEATIHQGTLGGLAGVTMTNNDTLAIAFRTGLAGRTNRGRNYWPLFLRTEITDNEVAALKVAAIISAYDALLDDNAFDATWEWSVISRKVIDVSGVGHTRRITSVKVNDRIVDSQRRRLPGRGQ